MTHRDHFRLLRASAEKFAKRAAALRQALANPAKLPSAAGIAEILANGLAGAKPSGPYSPDYKSTGTPPNPPGTTFTHGTYTCSAGTRPYRLFIPSTPASRPALLVMLHGCTQSPEDFAAGTRMNDLAEKRGLFVLYPAQIASANAQRCWNWFNPADTAREGGEAAVIAGMTRLIAAENTIDPTRIFVAGLSAGGALAAALGATYPDLFAAVGVHSGLASGAARDIAGAFMAMRQGREGHGHHKIRTILFHGDRDTTVSPRNADAIAAQVAGIVSGPVETLQGTSPGGLAYTRTLARDDAARPALERWTIHNAAHAWSGGSKAGSFTEPLGPDASLAMLDFFLS